MSNEVQYIKCKNSAGIVASFQAEWAERPSSTETDTFWLTQSATLDLASTTFPVGATVWPLVSNQVGAKTASDDHVVFGLNGKTAVYKITGFAYSYKVELDKIEEGAPPSGPTNFPAGIPVNQITFENWALTIDLSDIWGCAPRSAGDVAQVCNWAKDNGYVVRPRGIMHNWSPLSVPAELDGAKIMLIDTTKSLNNMTMHPATDNLPSRVTVGVGATMGELLAFLEKQAGGTGAASGFSFPHTPAPDHLTVGGVLAINGHGTAVRTLPDENLDGSYGSMSNHILELVIVGTDPADSSGEYKAITLQRGNTDTNVFLTQLGASFVIEATLHVVENYNMRCLSIMDIDWTDMFAQVADGSPLPANSFAHYLEESGRVEAIWYPFSTDPWLKVWTNTPEKPATSREVDGPNNYPFSDNLPTGVTDLIKKITTVAPGLTPQFGQMMQTVTKIGLNASPQAEDIWGASKNTLFYVKDTTLRVTANGYAVLMQRKDVQNGVAVFAKKYNDMLQEAKAKGTYPINGPLEIRVTGLDSPDHVPAMVGNNAGRPLISGLATDKETEKNGWDVAVWFDVLTLPGTPHADEFYVELEQWFFDTFNGANARVLPEWSKGWGYTKDNGAWSSPQFFAHIREAYTSSRTADDNWDYQVATLAKYDASGLFTSPLLKLLLVNTAGS